MENHAMSDLSKPVFLSKANWKFDDIARHEPDRAVALENSGPSDVLLKEILRTLDESGNRKNLRFGLNHRTSQPSDSRIVIQFGIGSKLFDWFFNARTGYRAHFRVSYESGLEFNKRIIEAFRDHLKEKIPDFIRCRSLNSEFEDCGEVKISKTLLVTSLDPDLSKIWYCTKRIKPDGGLEELLQGVTGAKILLNDDLSWVAPYREEDFAWLDIKGAFLGNEGLYQIKEPNERAKTLQTRGTA